MARSSLAWESGCNPDVDEFDSRAGLVKIWESGTVLHGYPRVVTRPGSNVETELEVEDVREFARDGNFFICLCLKDLLLPPGLV